MSVRVVARIRPLLKSENAIDTIVTAHAPGGCDDDSIRTVVKMPNPKNFSEEFAFQFNSVYDQRATQQDIFDAEVAPTVKHIFLGYDVTIFAYGSTGTGKTHTMRGGKSLADRGMIPRLLSSIYRRSRKLEKDSQGDTSAEVSMSYYEIYNDRVFDLFDAPEKRTATGLPLREAAGGKTVVVGLTELPCGTLKEFETLYDRANANRSTSATKLNAHSSRSHAILCVKVTVTSPTETRVSTASAIDLAGSEDNRRTGNGKDRMVESASINKSLFVLAQCVEAISKKQQRIPYRESKMTRILSLGQNNGFTVMILNLAPVKSYHLDTLSSLNFANRTKKIEVREVENEPMFKGPPRTAGVGPCLGGGAFQRQPLRPLTAGINMNIGAQQANAKSGDKPAKAFSVFFDPSKPGNSGPGVQGRLSSPLNQVSPLKRGPDSSIPLYSRPTKTMRPNPSIHRRPEEKCPVLSKASIEEMVEQKVSEILAARALNAVVEAPTKSISDEVQKRLDSIEQRLEGQEGARAEGLSYLLMAKQHQARGEDSSALKMYQMAVPYFPENEKLGKKIAALQEKLRRRREEELQPPAAHSSDFRVASAEDLSNANDESYRAADPQDGDSADENGDDNDNSRGKAKRRRKPHPRRRIRVSSPDLLASESRSNRDGDGGSGSGMMGHELSPRTCHLLYIINTRDVSQIKLLKGVGAKRAEGIVHGLSCIDAEEGKEGTRTELTSLQQLGQLRGVGVKSVESMRMGVEV